MSKIILDARSGDNNSQSTGLALRAVRGYSSFLNSSQKWVRPMRDLYENYELQGEYIYISEADGSLLDKGKVRRIEIDPTSIISSEGFTYYLTGIKESVEILSINDVAFVSSDFEIFYGGSKIRAKDNRVISSIEVKYKGVLFSYTRNDTERVRSKWVGGAWGLISGGSTLKVGIGSSTEADIRLDFLGGELRLGGDPSDVGSISYEIGGSQLPIISEDTLSDYVFSNNEVGVIGDESGLVRWNDSVSGGKDVYYVRGQLLINASEGADGLITVHRRSDDVSLYHKYEYYISPVPFSYEYPKIRRGFEGYLDVRFFADDIELLAEIGTLSGNEVGLSLSSGKLVSVFSDLYYEGLVLGHGGVLDYSEVSNGGSLNEGDSSVSGFGYFPDGSGFEPTGVGSGEGLVKDLELLSSCFLCVGGFKLVKILKVDSETIPASLGNNYGYYNVSDGKIYWGSGLEALGLQRQVYEQSISGSPFPRFTFIQAIVPFAGIASHVSQRKVKDTVSGQFTLSNDDVVSYDISSEGIVEVSGSAHASISPSGHLVISSDSGVGIKYPLSETDKAGLKNISLSPIPYILSGVVLSLTEGSVTHFSTLTNSEVGGIQELIFNFLENGAVPRTDFLGYSSGKYFRVGNKILENNKDILHRFSEGKIEWIENKTVIKKVRIPESNLFLSAGLKPNSTSIEISRTYWESSLGRYKSEKEVLVEGVDYDLPLDGQVGVARLKSELGKELIKGYQSILNGDGEFDLGSGYLANLVSLGDFLYLNKDRVYRRITSISPNPFKVESLDMVNGAGVRVEGTNLAEGDHGSWKIYDGYENDPDPTRVCDECSYTLEADNAYISVRKLYKISSNVPLDSAHPTSTLYLKGEDLKYCPIRVLIPLEVEGLTLDTTNDHFKNGSYTISVDGEVKTEGVDYTIDISSGSLTFDPSISTSGEVLFLPTPRVVSDTAEVLSDGSSLAVPANFPTDGVQLYLVEEIKDPSFQAETGAISFKRPLRRGVGVEVSYFPLNTDGSVGVRTVETMVFIQNSQSATRISDRSYTYNSEGFDIYLDVEPVVYAGTLPVGYGGELTPNFTQTEIILPTSISEDTPIMVTFATSSATGGEYTVKTSSAISIPVLEIAKGGNNLVLPYINTSIVAGQIFTMGASHSFKVSSVTEDISQEKTTIVFTPSARFDCRGKLEITSKDLSFIEVVDTIISCEPKGSEFLLQGDLTQSIVEDTILEIESTPYRVKVSTLLDNGVTKVEIHGYSSGHQATTYKYSVRPVYSEGSTSLKPIGGLIPEDGYTLIKESGGFGISLSPNVDYILDEQSGRISLKGHVIDRNTRYTLLFTAITTLAPIVTKEGFISYPKYTATFTESSVPEKYVGNTLYTTCTISTPDTFYIEVVDEDKYVSEVSAKLLSQASRTSGGRRAKFSFSNGVAFGLYEDLGKDIVARNRIKFYNGLIEPIDDIISTVSGNVIGDQDGKFKFTLNQSGTWGGAGLEDPITREVQPRYLTLEALSLSADPPLTPSNSLSESQFDNVDSLMKRQMKFLDNEMDDLVLTGAREKLEWKLALPFFEFKYSPIYEGMYSPSRVSRLFPEEAEFMTILAPSEIGRYTAGHEVASNPSDKSIFSKTREVVTRGTAIGRTENPAWGEIKNVTGISSLKKRFARFRIWDYSPIGFPEIPDYPHYGKPAIIATPMLFKDFPITEFGYPDVDALTAQDIDPMPAGAKKYPTIERGDINLKYKGLSVGDKIEIGRPKEGFSAVVNISEVVSVDNFGENAESISSPVFAEIEAIFGGCVIVLKGSASCLYSFGLSFLERPPERGDTLIESLRNNIDGKASSSKTYNVGENIGIRANTGELIDISYSSEKDLALLSPFEIHGFPLKEIMSQVVPDPLTPLGGRVTFANSSQTPFEYPALKGEPNNDSGDFTLPYIDNQSERDLLPQIGKNIRSLISTKYLTNYVFPDEIRLEGNTINGDIQSNMSLTPYSDDITQPSVNVRGGDLLVVDLEDNNSATGFIEIGGIEGNRILAPRFTSPVPASHLIKYDLENYFYANFSNSGIGISIKQENLNPTFRTTITLSSNNQGLKYKNLILLLEDNTPNGFYNRFKIKNIGGTNLWIEFQYDSATWYTYADDGAVGRNVISSITQNTDYEFVIISQDPIFNTAQWIILDQVSNYFPNTFDTAGQNFYLEGDNNTGVDYFIDLIFSDGEYISAGGGSTATQGASNTLEIKSDRVTLKDTSINFTNSYMVFDGSIKLKIYENEMEVTGGTRFYSFLNSHVYLNDSQGFDLKEEIDTDSFRVHSLRYKGANINLDPDTKMSVWTGSEFNKEGEIFNGLCDIGGWKVTNNTFTFNLSKLNLIKSGGILEDIRAGDLAFVEKSHHAGVYRVLDAVSEGKIDEPKILTLGQGAIKPLPKISSVDIGANTIVFDQDISDFYTSVAVGDKIGVVVSQTKITSTPITEADFVTSAIILTIVTYDIATKTLTYDPSSSVNLGSTSNFTGNHLFTLKEGQYITGINKIPISSFELLDFSNSGKVPVEINVEGIDISSSYAGGVTGTIGSNTHNLTSTYDMEGYLTHISFEAVFDNCVILQTSSYVEVEYVETDTVPVPPTFTVKQVPLFLLNRDSITLKYTIEKGIYTDKEFPRMGTRNYAGNNTHYFSTASAFGMSDLSEFFGSPNWTSILPNGSYTEPSNVIVRRLRRFTPEFFNLSSAFNSLNLLYEQRGGLVSTIVKDPSPPNLVSLSATKVNREGTSDNNGTSTQIGDFTDNGIINEGDYIRVYDNTNTEVLFLKVIGVTDEANLKCKYINGEIPSSINGHSFLIETKKHIIPQMQPYNQFVEVALSEEFSSTTGEVILDGGDLFLKSDDYDPTKVEINDYIVIDPAGLLSGTISEYGKPRQGDTGGVNGLPSVLDDNRGVYRVTEIDENKGLTVVPVYTYAGVEPGGYTLIPTISGVDGAGLRETREIVNGSYASEDFSIAPFKYRVMRRIEEVDKDLVDTMLFLRERTISWTEKMLSYGRLKPSTWSLYQSKGFIDYIGIGDPTHPSNQELLSIEGETTPSLSHPFTTSFDCLSVLDRRFLIEDTKVFDEGYGAIYTSISENVGIPTLLDSGISFMDAREIRYSWINVRVNRLTGTLPKIDRVDFSNPSQKALKDLE